MQFVGKIKMMSVVEDVINHNIYMCIVFKDAEKIPKRRIYMHSLFQLILIFIPIAIRAYKIYFLLFHSCTSCLCVCVQGKKFKIFSDISELLRHCNFSREPAQSQLLRNAVLHIYDVSGDRQE